MSVILQSLLRALVTAALGGGSLGRCRARAGHRAPAALQGDNLLQLACHAALPPRHLALVFFQLAAYIGRPRLPGCNCRHLSPKHIAT